MPKVRASSATIGTMRLPMSGSLSSCESMRTNTIVVDSSRSPRAFEHAREACRAAGTGSAGAVCGARRQVAAERLAPRVQIAHLGAVLGRLVEAQLVHVVVGERQREAVAEREQRVVLELLRLVRAHAALAPVAHAVAFLGLREDDRGPALVVHRGVIGGVDLDRVVAAAAQPVDVLVGQVRDDLLQLGILVEEMLAVEAPVGRGVFLELAVDGLVQAPDDDVLLVAREERIPVRAPQHLDHVPAGAGEQAFELLDDRAVAAHRSVEALQIAVHDEDQIVEAFARGERESGERFGLVHLAVADERPDLAALRSRGCRGFRDSA